MIKRRIVLITIGLLILGALLTRAWPLVGHWFSFSIVALYILSEARATVRRLSKLRTLSTRESLKLASTGAMVAVLVSSILAGQPIYFLLLVVLVYDLFYHEKRMKR